MATVTESDLLARALTSQGVDTFFHLMGGPMLETERALLAHAWTRLKGRPGVCMAASGPGTTNLVTGVANAFADAAPLVAIGGASSRVYFGMEAVQEIDQVAVMRPITKWADRVLDAKRVPELVATAFRQATAGRPGPVYLDLPGDILGEKGDDTTVTFPPPWKAAPRTLGDPAAITEAVALLARAERPLILTAAASSGRRPPPRSRPSSTRPASRSTRRSEGDISPLRRWVGLRRMT